MLRPSSTSILFLALLALVGCSRHHAVLSVEDLNPVGTVADAGPRLHVRAAGRSLVTAPGDGADQTISIEVAAQVVVDFSWRADPDTTFAPYEYRWTLDPREPGRGRGTQHGRDDPPGLEPHASGGWSPDAHRVKVGPFEGGEEHLLVIEARGRRGFHAKLIVEIHVVASTFMHDLLIVDDTRFAGDEIGPGGCVRAPTGPWPSAAELDTFLYARGSAGTPSMPSDEGGISAPTVWRCYPPGGAATMTPSGLFAGYAFDTTGTRRDASSPTVPLAELEKYSHVIWIADGEAAKCTGPPGDPYAPITALRWMSTPGAENMLAEYVRGGGRIWLIGAGVAPATLWPWNDASNDVADGTWSDQDGELVPGRFMYDFVHWRSEIQSVRASGFVLRDLGRNPSWPGAPDCLRLPVTIRGKSPALDPFPPGRVGQGSSVFYNPTHGFTFLSKPNVIVEGSGERAVSTLDTLYKVTTFAVPPTTGSYVLMTYYHGADNSPVMFTGFDIWDFTHDDCQAVVDFVLHDVWGLQKNLGPPEALARATPGRR